jgi:hypothetical protein
VQELLEYPWTVLLRRQKQSAPSLRRGDFSGALVEIYLARSTIRQTPHTSYNGDIMAKKIYVNLPVKDLKKTIDFFTRLGFEFNQQFTDETATCMIVSDDIFVMLLTRDKFKTFTPNAICDARKHTEVLVCLSLDSRAEVDDMVRKAVAAGGTTYNEPQDHGFMYGHGFQDPDGHIWELVYMEANG